MLCLEFAPRKEKFIINNNELCRTVLLISISMKRNCKQPRAALDSLNIYAFVASSFQERFSHSFIQFHSCMHSMYLIRTFIIVYTFNFLLNSIIVHINSFAYRKACATASEIPNDSLEYLEALRRENVFRFSVVTDLLETGIVSF